MHEAAGRIRRGPTRKPAKRREFAQVTGNRSRTALYSRPKRPLRANAFGGSERRPLRLQVNFSRWISVKQGKTMAKKAVNSAPNQAPKPRVAKRKKTNMP